MNPINASSLFHFTKTFKGLQGILKNSFRYSYCLEQYPSSVIHNSLNPFKPTELCTSIYNGIAIPEICFCDIPITRAQIHAKKYGKYAIGIDKNIAKTLYNKNLNPVFYLSSDNLWYSIIDLSVLKSDCIRKMEGKVVDGKNYRCVKIETETEKLIFNHNAVDSIDRIIAFSKYESGKNEKGDFVNYYDEREWRSVIYDRQNENSNWIYDFQGHIFKNCSEFKNWIKPYNNALHKCSYAYLPLTEEYTIDLLSNLVTHIIVKKENQIPPLINYITKSSNLFGKSFNNDKDTEFLKSILISRITSFERIENDY